MDNLIILEMKKRYSKHKESGKYKYDNWEFSKDKQIQEMLLLCDEND